VCVCLQSSAFNTTTLAMSDVDMFESDDRTEVVLQTSCSSESESDTERYRGRRSLDMSVLFAAKKRKPYTPAGTPRAPSGSCHGSTTGKQRQPRRTLCVGTARSGTSAGNGKRPQTNDVERSSPPLPSVQQDPGDPEVKSALREITSLLNTVVKRVEKVECELKQQRSTPSSSSDSTPSKHKQKADVPLVIRVC